MFIYKDEGNNDQFKQECKECNYILSNNDEANKVGNEIKEVIYVIQSIN